MVRFILYLIFLFVLQYESYSQSTSKYTKIDKYIAISEDCEIEDIPAYSDSIFELTNQLKKTITNKLELKKVEIYEAATFNNLGFYTHENNDIEKAFMYYHKARVIYETWNDSIGLANAYNNLGMTTRDKGDIPNAIEYILKAIKINQLCNSLPAVATGYNNIGTMYYIQQEYDLAFQFYEKAYIICSKGTSTKELAYSMNNMAACLVEQKKYSQALNYFERSLELRKKLKTVDLIPNYNNIAFMHRRLKNYVKAIEFYNIALALEDPTKLHSNLGATNLGLANVMMDLGKTEEALQFAEKAYYVYSTINLLENKGNAAQLLHRIFAEKKNYDKAYEFLSIMVICRDSINSEKNKKTLFRQQAKFEYEKKSYADSLKTFEEKKVVAAQLKQEKTQRFALYGGLFMLLLFVSFVFNRLKVTQKQKSIIERKEQETQNQKHIIEEKQKEIVDSITYAKRLQEAILPPQEFIDKHLPNNFVLYKPKDLVAGDFYWAETIGDLFFIAAADSTGHGVPGAMVSVVCSNALNRSVKEFHLIDTGKILDKTRELVIETFEKSTSEVKDGMDISLLCFDKSNKRIFWSGANNPLWYIENHELKEIKADKQPIGKTEYPKEFTTHYIDVVEGILFYLMTDGYADQFGGPKGKKFKYKQLSDLLISINNESLEIQKQKLNNAFDAWKGDLEQVDDVCIIGIQL